MYRLLNKIIDARVHFPKEFRYEFASDIIFTALNCMKYIRYANSDMYPPRRADNLMKLRCELDNLGVLLRICEERKFTSIKASADIALLLTSVGRQATGWYKKRFQIGKKKQVRTNVPCVHVSTNWSISQSRSHNCHDGYGRATRIIYWVSFQRR